MRLVEIPPTETIEYNEKGLIVSQTDPLQRKTTFEYNENDWLVKKIYPDPGDGKPAPVETYAYDQGGRKVHMTYLADGESLTTRYIYNRLDQLIRQNDPNGRSIRFTYDAAGNRISQTDAIHNQTFYAYDSFNRPVSEQITVTQGNAGTSSPKTVVNHSEYDTEGNLTKFVDKNGQRIEKVYDQNDRLIQEHWYESEKFRDSRPLHFHLLRHCQPGLYDLRPDLSLRSRNSSFRFHFPL